MIKRWANRLSNTKEGLSTFFKKEKSAAILFCFLKGENSQPIFVNR